MALNLNDLELMSFPEASLRWNKERTYVTQQYMKYPHKFLEGSTAVVGNGKKKFYIITKEGMEYLMKQTEKEANQKQWLVRCQKDWTIVTFEQKVDSEIEARNLIASQIASKTRNTTVQINYEQIHINPPKYRVVSNKNVVYTYEKLKKNKSM